MWFMQLIVDWLESASDFFYDAYRETAGWVYPFSLLSIPMYSLYSVFDVLAYYFGVFDDWLVQAADWLAQILSFDDIWNYFQGWFQAAESAWQWVVNAVYNIWNVIEDWWSGVYFDVLDLFHSAMDAAYNYYQSAVYLIDELRDQVQGIIDQIPALDEVVQWIGNWVNNVLTLIDQWWSGAVNQVQALIDSAFIARDSLWSGWQEIRDQVVEFFSDPLEWVYNKMDEFFERFW